MSESTVVTHFTRRLGLLMLSMSIAGAAVAAPATDEGLRQQVFAAERAFAKSMADRDFDAFARYVAEDTVFFSGPAPQHGKQAVLEKWKQFFDGPDAPFSWQPDQVEVLAGGTLAHSSGPVHDPSGKLVSRFNSVWQRQADGQWRVIFDRGEPVCPPAAQ